MSSLVFLAISMIVFVIVFGMMFTLAPMILGAFFTALPTDNLSPSWLGLNINVEDTVKMLVQLMPSFGIAVIVFKVLMVSTVRGGD